MRGKRRRKPSGQAARNAAADMLALRRRARRRKTPAFFCRKCRWGANFAASRKGSSVRDEKMTVDGEAIAFSARVRYTLGREEQRTTACFTQLPPYLKLRTAERCVTFFVRSCYAFHAPMRRTSSVLRPFVHKNRLFMESRLQWGSGAAIMGADKVDAAHPAAKDMC